MPVIGNIFGQQTSAPPTKALGSYVVPVKMGIEVEIEDFQGVSSDEVTTRWNVIPDNSLRNSGLEFVLKKPLYGDVLESAIKALDETLSSASFSLSHRCSVHVHIDFRSTEIECVETFFMLYMLLEPALYTISSKDRYNNIYCPGLTHTTDLIKTAAIGFASNDMNGLVNSWNKYTGINLLPLASLGSIEIRTHSGTGTGSDILEWTQILNCIYAASLMLSVEDINKVSSPQELLDLVFIDELIPKLMCDNLLRYWNSSKLNLIYYNLITTVLEDNRTAEHTAGGLDNQAVTELFRRS
jgi:hypothetical protein